MTETVSQRSKELFGSGFYCAESVLLAIMERKGLQSDIAPRIATGFCSGMARTGGTCGAVSGAIMGLSLESGRSSPEENIDKTYDKVKILLDNFEEKFGSTKCPDLIECDLNTEEGQLAYKENNRFVQCLEYTGEAAKMAMELIEE
jgi:C_GCAxxG_C_C family probable redox protein